MASRSRKSPKKRPASRRPLPPAAREGGALLAIWAAGWAAQGGCLRAAWFLDDWGKIVNNPGFSTRTADLSLSALTEWSYHLFGGSGTACHLGNLVFHLLLASLVWWCGPLFFRHAAGRVPTVDPRLASFFGALVFAVHPLCSEVTHYARARDHEFVALFSFLTAVAALLWLKRGWRWAPALLAAAGLAMLSKGPGPVHAALAVGAVCLFFGTRGELRARLVARWTLYAAIGGPLALAVAAPGKVLEWTSRVTGSWQGGLFGLHALTQARVFWDYARKMVWPAGLCPDHLVAYTKNAADPVAWAGLGGTVLLLAGIVVLWRCGFRLIAFLVFMIAANLWLRWLYVLSELMVEYRVYPSMPYLGLLAGFGLAAMFRWRRAAALALLGVVLAAGIGLTRQRSAVWSSSEALTDSILREYPWQLRVFMERTYIDYLHRDPDAALARMPDFYARLHEVLAWNDASPSRAYANWPLWVVCVECNVADTLVRADRLREAEEILHRTRQNMIRNGITDDVLWDTWYFSRAKLENRRGDHPWAWLHLQQMGGWFFDPADYDAELKKARDGMAASHAELRKGRAIR